MRWGWLLLFTDEETEAQSWIQTQASSPWVHFSVVPGAMRWPATLRIWEPRLGEPTRVLEAEEGSHSQLPEPRVVL